MTSTSGSRPEIVARPARELVEAAADPDLLVVAHRGPGALTGMVLWSVGLRELAS